MKPVVKLMLSITLLLSFTSAFAQGRGDRDRDRSGVRFKTSKTLGGRMAKSFQYETDTIYYTVKAGANSVACVEAIVPSRGQSNLGYCEDLNNFVSMIDNEEWSFDGDRTWSLESVLNGHIYMVRGTFRFFWMDVDTEDLVGPHEITVE